MALARGLSCFQLQGDGIGRKGDGGRGVHVTTSTGERRGQRERFRGETENIMTKDLQNSAPQGRPVAGWRMETVKMETIFERLWERMWDVDLEWDAGLWPSCGIGPPPAPIGGAAKKNNST